MAESYPVSGAPHLSYLIEAFSKDHRPSFPEGPKIKVSEAVSTLAFLYEKVRQAMEYQESHLLRRAAVERILMRRLRPESNASSVAEALVKELIRGRYLENNTYPESLIAVVGKTLEKYVYLLQKIEGRKEGMELSEWLMRLASSEIEEIFTPPNRDDALAAFMYTNISKAAILKDDTLNENEKRLQLYLAIYKTLLKLDRAMLEFNLFELFYPNWKQADYPLLEEVGANLIRIKERSVAILGYPLGGALAAQVKRYVPPFFVLRDALEKEGAKILGSQIDLVRAVRTAYQRRYERERARLATAATRALIYIFLTKILLSLAFELPAERFIYGEVRRIPFMINFFFPPLLIFLLTLSLTPPGRENEERVVKAVEGAVFGGGDGIFSEQYRVEVKKRSRTLSLVLFLLYLATFAVIFGAVSYLLRLVDFTLFGILLFFFYTSVVMYFGVRVRDSSRELVMVGGKETIASVLLSFISLPFLKVGSYVSIGLSRFNFLVLFATLLIEAPFQKLIEILEEWVSFMREKKEEVY